MVCRVKTTATKQHDTIKRTKLKNYVRKVTWQRLILCSTERFRCVDLIVCMSQCIAVYNHFVNGYVFYRQQQQQQMSFSVSREMSFRVSARTHFTHAMWLLFVVYRCYIFEAVY